MEDPVNTLVVDNVTFESDCPFRETSKDQAGYSAWVLSCSQTCPSTRKCAKNLTIKAKTSFVVFGVIVVIQCCSQSIVLHVHLSMWQFRVSSSNLFQKKVEFMAHILRILAILLIACQRSSTPLIHAIFQGLINFTFWFLVRESLSWNTNQNFVDFLHIID